MQEAREQGEWEPGEALREALGGMPLSGPAQDGHLARLGPLLREALGELGRLERRGGLSPDERVMREALEGLLAASGEEGPGG